MMKRLRPLVADRRGAAAAEMAMSLPMLILILFGSVELGYYFMSEHIVQKAVRDAARYAARLPVSNYDCTSSTVVNPVPIQRVARFGNPDATTGARIEGWTADGMTSVTLTCDSNLANSYVSKGLFSDFPNGGAVPVVTVHAAVPYPSLFGTIGIPTPTLMLNAESQTAVFGA